MFSLCHFDEKQKINIINVQLNGDNADFTFTDNQLLVNIGKLFNQQKAKIKNSGDLAIRRINQVFKNKKEINK